MKIKKLDHCKYCSHQKLSPQKGIICNLTQMKPNFRESCMKFAVAPASLKTAKNLIIDFELAKKEANASKLKLWGSIIVTLIAGATIFLLYNIILEYGFIWVGALALIGFFIVNCSIQLRKHENASNKVKILYSKRKKMDHLFSLYQVDKSFLIK